MRLMNIIVCIEQFANCFIILTSPLTDALTIKLMCWIFWTKVEHFYTFSQLSVLLWKQTRRYSFRNQQFQKSAKKSHNEIEIHSVKARVENHHYILNYLSYFYNFQLLTSVIRVELLRQSFQAVLKRPK